MPSVLGLMEQHEARARQELESWSEVLEQAQAKVDAARERVERALVGREELVSVLAEESTVNTPVSAPSGGEAVAAVGSSGSGAGHGERPPVWRSGMGEEVLGGVYREVFAAVVAASGPVNGGGVDAGGGPGGGDQKRGGEDPPPCLRAGEAGLAGAGEGWTVHAGAWSSRCGRFSGQCGASPARLRDSLITAAHHTICWWWSGRRSWSRLRRRERESQLSVRSTTHLRASTTNPRCPSDRRTTSIRTPWRANAFTRA